MSAQVNTNRGCAGHEIRSARKKSCASALAAHVVYYEAPVIADILETDALMRKTLEKWVFGQFRRHELDYCEFLTQ